VIEKAMVIRLRQRCQFRITVTVTELSNRSPVTTDDTGFVTPDPSPIIRY